MTWRKWRESGRLIYSFDLILFLILALLGIFPGSGDGHLHYIDEYIAIYLTIQDNRAYNNSLETIPKTLTSFTVGQIIHQVIKSVSVRGGCPRVKHLMLCNLPRFPGSCGGFYFTTPALTFSGT